MEQETASLAQGLQSWLLAQGVPLGADSARVVFDGTHAHIVATTGGQRLKLVVPFPLHLPPSPPPPGRASTPTVAKKKAATRQR